MKSKDFFSLIDAVNDDEIREDSVMYRNAFEAILALKDNVQLDVFRWFFAYSLYGIQPKFDEKLIENRQNKSSIEFVFSLLKKQRIGWEKSKNQRDRHIDPIGGCGGGTPQGTLSHTRDKQVSKDTSISDDIQVPNGTSPNGQGKQTKRKGFVKEKFAPPTIEEVKAYCQERRNGIDPEHFCDYYESNGWMVGKNKMKDWKAAVRTWEKKEEGKSKIDYTKFL